MDVLVATGMWVLKFLALVAYVVSMIVVLNWATYKGYLGAPIEEGGEDGNQGILEMP